MNPPPAKPRFRPLLLVAEILLMLITLFLLAAMWMPIPGFRMWVAKFIPALGPS